VPDAPAPATDELASSLELAAEAPKKRALVIVNPYATTVSDRLRHLVVYALAARYDVEAVDTQARGHATEICREAAHEGYDVVIAFGGDGTVNEAANGLAGSTTPLSCLPGGNTNVYCRLLGIPGEIVDATEHLLHLADRWEPRRVDLGCVNGRYFVFSAGVGIDASTVQQVDQHPRLKARLGPFYFTFTAFTTFAGRYVGRAPRMEVSIEGETIDGVTVVVQNGEHYTYFNDRPVDIAEGATLDGGSLAAAVLKRANLLDIAPISVRSLSRHLRLGNHRHVEPFSEIVGLSVRSAGGGPLPLEVDGDYIGDAERADFQVVPQAISVVA
jgi:diacylglycerol kinase family enzyme